MRGTEKTFQFSGPTLNTFPVAVEKGRNTVILDYLVMLGNLFPKSWPDKQNIYRRVPNKYKVSTVRYQIKSKLLEHCLLAF